MALVKEAVKRGIEGVWKGMRGGLAKFGSNVAEAWNTRGMSNLVVDNALTEQYYAASAAVRMNPVMPTKKDAATRKSTANIVRRLRQKIRSGNIDEAEKSHIQETVKSIRQRTVAPSQAERNLSRRVFAETRKQVKEGVAAGKNFLEMAKSGELERQYYSRAYFAKGINRTLSLASTGAIAGGAKGAYDSTLGPDSESKGFIGSTLGGALKGAFIGAGAGAGFHLARGAKIKQFGAAGLKSNAAVKRVGLKEAMASDLTKMNLPDNLSDFAKSVEIRHRVAKQFGVSTRKCNEALNSKTPDFRKAKPAKVSNKVSKIPRKRFNFANKG